MKWRKFLHLAIAASPCGAVLSTTFQLHNEQLLKDHATLYLTRSTMPPSLLLSNLIYVLPTGAESYSERVMCVHLGVIGECKVEIQNFMNQVIIWILVYNQVLYLKDPCYFKNAFRPWNHPVTRNISIEFFFKSGNLISLLILRSFESTLSFVDLIGRVFYLLLCRRLPVLSWSY